MTAHTCTDFDPGCYRCDLARDEIDSPETWASRHNWGVTTAADCLGQPPDSIDGWALYDEAEDDPPVAIFSFRADAEMVCQILRDAAPRP